MRNVVILLIILLTNVFLSLRITQHTSKTHPPFVQQHPEHGQSKITPSNTTTANASSSSSKLILAYTNIYGREFDITTYGRVGYEIEQSANPLDNCKYTCRWSTNKLDYSKSDAVLFHLYNNQQNKDFVLRDLPERHSVDQKWILMAREPQAFFHPRQLQLLKDKFNLTMTFQSDSDVVIPYGSYWNHSPASLAYRKNMRLEYMAGKDKMVAWLVSNCKTSSRREDYVKQLQKHISVDVYGRCGNLTTDTNSANGFRDQIAKQYKFYIAFENADCDDYISEKFWNSLRIGIIPIVRGQRARYKKLAPPNSYIHAESFLTPEGLAKYLKELSSNSTLFHKYHEWRRTYDANDKFFTTNTQWMCELCEKVHTSPQQSVDIYEHFSEDTRCFTYLDHNGRDRTGEHVEDIERV